MFQYASGITTGASAAGAALVVTLPSIVTGTYKVFGMHYSYSDTPSGGSLTLASGATTLYRQDIFAAGPGKVDFTPHIQGAHGVSMVATLAAPGGSVVGRLTMQYNRHPET